MIDTDYVAAMARYNRWQNESLYATADSMNDAVRRAPRGAFFGSIHGTLNHILWGDRMWMHRFAGTPRPEGGIEDSPDLIENWCVLKTERALFDDVIENWAMALRPSWLSEPLTWHSMAVNHEFTKPRWLLVTHMFNHQTHHRGQVHAMLTAAGGRPDNTDLMPLDIGK